MSDRQGQAAEIARLLANYLSEEVIADGSAVDPEQNLLGDGAVDSLGMLRLVGFIEVTFDTRIAPDQFTIENFRSINTISNYVSNLIHGAGA